MVSHHKEIREIRENIFLLNSLASL